MCESGWRKEGENNKKDSSDNGKQRINEGICEHWGLKHRVGIIINNDFPSNRISWWFGGL